MKFYYNFIYDKCYYNGEIEVDYEINTTINELIRKQVGPPICEAEELYFDDEEE